MVCHYNCGERAVSLSLTVGKGVVKRFEIALRKNNMEEKIFESHSCEETERFAAEFAKELVPGDFIAFFGDLGSGKIAFEGVVASYLCPAKRVSSPTFAIVNEYNGGRIPLFHFDMYRILDDDNLFSTGFYDYFDRGGIIAAEWCENIPFALPEHRYEVVFEKCGENERKIKIVNRG